MNENGIFEPRLKTEERQETRENGSDVREEMSKITLLARNCIFSRFRVVGQLELGIAQSCVLA